MSHKVSQSFTTFCLDKQIKTFETSVWLSSASTSREILVEQRHFVALCDVTYESVGKQGNEEECAHVVLIVQVTLTTMSRTNGCYAVKLKMATFLSCKQMSHLCEQ